MSQEPAVIRRRTPRSQRRRDGLIHYAHSVHSQNGEDGVLARLFSTLPSPSSTHRWCVDVGAWDGQHLSNTHELLFSDTEKWKGVLLEADTEKFAQLKERHKDTDNICLNVTISAASVDDPQNLCNILQQDDVPLPTIFDFLCIDIDGSDYWVWHDLLLQDKYCAKVVCIEFNPTMPDDLIYIPPREQRHGASLSALVELAQAHEYILVETTLYNAFFIQRPLYEQYLQDEVPDTSIEALHECTMGTSLYQLYDGTLKLWGCKKLLWHRIALDEKKLQVLPVSERHFPFAPRIDIEEDSSASRWSEQAVDLNPFRSDSDAMVAQRESTCQRLLDQLETHGFALVHGTGMDPHTCRAALQASQSLLQDADESVRKSCLSPTDRARRGYAPMNVENFASLLGQVGANDLVRKYRIGPVDNNINNSVGSQIHDINSSLLQPNIWPTAETWDESDTFRSAAETYYQSACEAANMVMAAICQGLIQKHPELESALEALLAGTTTSPVDAKSDDTNESTHTTTSILTLLGYRNGTRHKGKNKGPLVAAHTDVGVITMLLFDGGTQTCAGLQRSDGKGGWVDVELPARVPQADPIFVINVADCLSDLSGGRLPSTIHRVIANRKSSNIPRNCCALFVGLDPQSELTIGGEQMTYEEWRRRRIERSQKVLKTGLST
jgi:isopenicillin N synthase-like dioxygenase